MKEVIVGEYLHEIQYRPLARNGLCRCCWKDIAKDSEQVIWAAGGRDAVIICRDCVDAIILLTVGEKN